MRQQHRLEPLNVKLWVFHGGVVLVVDLQQGKPSPQSWKTWALEEPRGPRFSKRPYKTRRRRNSRRNEMERKAQCWKEKKTQRNPRKGADDPRLALEQVLKEARKKEGKEMEEGLSKLNFLGRSKRWKGQMMFWNPEFNIERQRDLNQRKNMQIRERVFRSFPSSSIMKRSLY